MPLFVKPTVGLREFPTEKTKVKTSNINMVVNVEATVTTFAKRDLVTYDSAAKNLKYAIEFYANDDSLFGVWIYNDKTTRDSDFTNVLGNI